MSSVGPRRIVIDGLRSLEIQQVCRLLLKVALSLDDLLRLLCSAIIVDYYRRCKHGITEWENMPR
jgi:hypothetical protein